MRHVRELTLVCTALFGGALLTGCATIQLGTHQPTPEAVTSLRASAIGPVSVGDFHLAKSAKPDIDQQVSSRGSTESSSIDHSFSHYLRAALIADLQAAGRYDAASPRAIEGELTESTLETGMSEGSSTLAARFVVKEGTSVLYDKVLRQDSKWESSIVGAIAIPRAFNEYNNQYSKLLDQLYADKAFVAACTRK
jgi:hypothetical protein